MIVLFGGTTAGVQLHVPSGCTNAVQIITLLGSFTVTISPGSPVPVIGDPSVGFSTGADGDVVNASLTFVVVGGLTVFPGSVAVAVITVPVVSGVAKLQIHIPAIFATTGALVQVAGDTVIVAPGTAVPVTTLSILLIGLIVGVADFVAGS